MAILQIIKGKFYFIQSEVLLREIEARKSRLLKHTRDHFMDMNILSQPAHLHFTFQKRPSYDRVLNTASVQTIIT
jgi:hypothetical protein